MRFIIISALVTLACTSCGYLPASSPERHDVRNVTFSRSSRTITFNQDMCFSYPNSKALCLPKGTYKHVATDDTYYYFKSPSYLQYVTLNPSGHDKSNISGGVSIPKQKFIVQPAAAYMDSNSDEKLVIFNMLGGEFTVREGEEWKRDY